MHYHIQYWPMHIQNEPEYIVIIDIVQHMDLFFVNEAPCGIKFCVHSFRNSFVNYLQKSSFFACFIIHTCFLIPYNSLMYSLIKKNSIFLNALCTASEDNAKAVQYKGWRYTLLLQLEFNAASSCWLPLYQLLSAISSVCSVALAIYYHIKNRYVFSVLSAERSIYLPSIHTFISIFFSVLWLSFKPVIPYKLSMCYITFKLQGFRATEI